MNSKFCTGGNFAGACGKKKKRVCCVAETESSPETPQLLSLDQFKKLSSACGKDQIEASYPFFNGAAQAANVVDPCDLALFISQTSEPDTLGCFDDSSSKNDKDEFANRSPIKIHGKGMYKKVGKSLGIDLVKEPETASMPAIGWDIAAHVWKKYVLWKNTNFAELTKGLHGTGEVSSRMKQWQKAKEVLKCK